MWNTYIFIALLLVASPVFAEQRTSSNQASATLQINVFVSPSLNTPAPARQRQLDHGIIFQLSSPSNLKSTSEEVPISAGMKLISPNDADRKTAVLRTITYTAE